MWDFLFKTNEPSKKAFTNGDSLENNDMVNRKPSFRHDDEVYDKGGIDVIDQSVLYNDILESPGESESGASDSLNTIKDTAHCADKKFIAYLCTHKHMCGGLGDRQKGLVSTYLLALLTNRTFVILHETPCNLSNFFSPNQYDWTRCHDYVSALPKSESQELIIMGRYKFRNAIKYTNFDETFNEKVIYIRTNQVWIKEIMSHPKGITNIPWAVNKSIPEILNKTLDILFRPNNLLDNDLKYFLGNFSKSGKWVCSHIRMGRSATMPHDNDRRLGVPNVTTIFQFLQKFDHSDNVIYIASDSEAVRESVKGNFSSGVTLDMPVIHVDKGRHERDQKQSVCTGMYSAILEQQILSNCDLIVVTYSVMGTMSTYISKKAQDVYLYYYKSESVIPVKYYEQDQYFPNIS